jgi:hypothetical protein
MQWAQSLDDIYLRIKLSHRQDSPGCIDPIDPKVSLNVTHFTFEAHCIQDDLLIKYFSHFELFAGSNITKPWELTRESIGRYQVIIPKGQTGMYWDKIQEWDAPLPPNLKVWFEMKEKLNDTHVYIWEDEEEVVYCDLICRRIKSS